MQQELLEKTKEHGVSLLYIINNMAELLSEANNGLRNILKSDEVLIVFGDIIKKLNACEKMYMIYKEKHKIFMNLASYGIANIQHERCKEIRAQYNKKMSRGTNSIIIGVDMNLYSLQINVPAECIYIEKDSDINNYSMLSLFNDKLDENESYCAQLFDFGKRINDSLSNIDVLATIHRIRFLGNNIDDLVNHHNDKHTMSLYETLGYDILKLKCKYESINHYLSGIIAVDENICNINSALNILLKTESEI